MKGQAAIMDALIFMLIASSAATLLLFVTTLYSSSTNDQIMTIYNYEYAGNALIALHYAKDSEGKWFWNELKAKLDYDPDEVEDYLEGDAQQVWQKVMESSPAGQGTFMCFKGAGLVNECYPFDKDTPESTTIYSSSVKMTSEITVILKLFY